MKSKRRKLATLLKKQRLLCAFFAVAILLLSLGRFAASPRFGLELGFSRSF
jgi:hypothetical protein